MLCPKCKVEMSALEFAGERVDQCRGCRGMWFDAGELAAIRQLKRRSSSRAPALLQRQGDVVDLLCPQCGGPSLEVERAEVFVLRRCVGCHGIFLDGAEVEKLLESWKSLRRRQDSEHGDPSSVYRDEEFHAAVFAAIYPAIF